MIDNFIERCPHDRENPYTMINRGLIRDPSISPACKWLLIYLLSNDKGWKISVKQVMNYLKDFHGRDSVYKIFNEAIEAGYMRREKGQKICTYFISEFPKFKEMSEFTEFQDSEIPYTENQDALRKSNSSVKKEQEEEESLLSAVRAASLSACAEDCTDQAKEKPKKEKKPKENIGMMPKSVPEKALDAANFLWLKVVATYPRTKEPDIEKWAKELDLLNRRDNKSWEEIRDMINWAYDDAFWVQVIQSPTSLRKHWDKMQTKRTPVNNKGKSVEKNKELAIEVKQHLNAKNKGQSLHIFANSVKNVDKNESVSLELPPEQFEKILSNWFNLRFE